MDNKNNIQLHDVNLHEAVKRYEQKRVPMPTDLNDKVMQRLLEEQPVRIHKRAHIWFYATIAAAAACVILIFTYYNNIKDPAKQLPITAKQVQEKTMTPIHATEHEEQQVALSQVKEQVEEQATTERPSKTLIASSKTKKRVSADLHQVSASNDVLVNTEPGELEQQSDDYPSEDDIFQTYINNNVQHIRSRGEQLYMEVAQLMNNQ
ncbi:MAG: hypothetical protein K5874_05055 [Bacteroidaceae bacterium]|nr:hypothetical protein [Bacteroidaceae bacterium]